MAAGSKVKKSGSGNFAKGGKGAMFGKQNADTMVPGQTAKKTSGKGGKGGKGNMFGKQSAGPMPAGRTGKC